MKYILFFFSLLSATNLFGQQFIWAKNCPGTGQINGDVYYGGITADLAGNIYTTAFWEQSYLVSIPPKTDTFNVDNFLFFDSATYNDHIYIAKYNSNGNVIWAKSFASGIGAYFSSVAIDPWNNVYFSGEFTADSITFGNQTFHNAGGIDIFFAKYDSSGNVLWAKHYGGDSHDEPNGLAIDDAGNIYMTGVFLSDTLIFGTYPLISGEFFFVKYDSAGNVKWAKTCDSPANVYGDWIGTDHLGNIYVSGPLSSMASFNGHVIDPANGIAFISKYDSTGSLIWIKNFPAGSSKARNSFVIDNTGNIYFAGAIYRPITIFGNDTLRNTDSTGNTTDFFIAKISTDGNFIWAKSGGSNASNEYTFDIVLGKHGDIYFTGGEADDSSVAFGNITLTPAASAPDPLFLFGCDTLGNVLCGTLLSSGGEDECAITSDFAGNLYLYGDYYADPFIVGNDTFPDPGLTITETIFLAKYAPCYTLSINSPQQIDQPVFLVYPNPNNGSFTITGTINDSKKVDIVIFNELGQTVYSEDMIIENGKLNEQINLDVPPGIYMIRLSTTNGNSAIKLVIN